MKEKQLFRFTLLALVCLALGLWSAWGYHVLEARAQDQTVDHAVEYQMRMEKTCQTSPAFPACIRNEEYMTKRLTAVLASMESHRRAEKIVPWAISLPIALLLCFYAIRWGVTGRVRPLWLL